MTDEEREIAQDVRTATAALEVARARRDEYIRARAQDERSNVADLARKFGLSREATYKIIRGKGGHDER
jgi:hypothetical protein